MTRYDATAWCDFPHYTTFEVEADSIEEALAKAQTQVSDEYPEPFNGAPYEWNEFEVEDDDGETIRHLAPERATEIPAPALLESLQRGVIAAQGVTDSWERGDLAEAVRNLSLWLPDAADAIKQATNT